MKDICSSIFIAIVSGLSVSLYLCNEAFYFLVHTFHFQLTFYASQMLTLLYIAHLPHPTSISVRSRP